MTPPSTRPQAVEAFDEAAAESRIIFNSAPIIAHRASVFLFLRSGKEEQKMAKRLTLALVYLRQYVVY